MTKHNQDGGINVLLLPLILTVVFLLAALGFGIWAYGSRQDYKDNSDEKAAAAVDVAKQQQSIADNKQYNEAAKRPLVSYQSPEQFGSIIMQYPKTWSAYVDAGGSGSQSNLDGYFNPAVVPSISDANSSFAVRLKVVDQSYSSILSSFQGNKNVTVAPYTLPKVPKVVGVRVDGQIESQKQGTMVILPDRDKTLQVYTEVSAYKSDFDNIILPNLTFSP